MEGLYAVMETPQEQKSNIQLFFELQAKRKAVMIELKNRHVALGEIQRLTGIHAFYFNREKLTDKNLVNLSIPELTKLAIQTKKDYNAVSLKLQSKQLHVKKGSCPVCGKIVEANEPRRKTNKHIWHLTPCWDGKLID